MASDTGNESHRKGGRKPPRLNHKKSKSGCRLCKARRVKCDEKRPKCGGCERHSVSCEYDVNQHPVPISIPEETIRQADKSISETADPKNDQTQHEFEEPDSRSRRLLELRLVHHFAVSTSQTLPGADIPDVRELWAVEVPRLAFEHNCLLYSLLAISALHLLESHSNDATYKGAYKRYFVLALHEHNRAISILNSQTADVVCLTCLLISILALGPRSMDPNDPYSLPLESLRVSHGSGQVFNTAWACIRGDISSKAATIVKSSPQYKESHDGTLGFDRETRRLIYPKENLVEFAHLLPPTQAADSSDELWDSEVERVYQDALSYIGSIHKAVQAQEPQSTISRRLMGFSTQIPKRFIDMIEEGRPRALVILAHFFALAGGRRGHLVDQMYGGAGGNWNFGIVANRLEALDAVAVVDCR